MKIGIVNYGMGNLGSVRKALEDLGADAVVMGGPEALADVNRIILPGVGAFAEGMSRLRDEGWFEAIRDAVQIDRKVILGICLGMQMLATEGEEGGACAGLDLVAGRVKRLDLFGCDLKIPHVGWNDVVFTGGEPLFSHVPQNSDFYFVHSFAFESTLPEQVVATVQYGIPVVAAVRNRNAFGTQFHPEKSSKAGRQLLRNFLEYVPC